MKTIFQEQKKNQDDSHLIVANYSQTVRDVAKLEVIVENLRARVEKLETKMVALIMLQSINLALLVFVLTTLFELSKAK